MSSKSVERRCGKDGHWGPGLPRCKGDHHHHLDDHNDDDDDGADCAGDDDDNYYQPWHALYLGHFLPRDTLSNNHCPVPLMDYDDCDDDEIYDNYFFNDDCDNQLMMIYFH